MILTSRKYPIFFFILALTLAQTSCADENLSVSTLSGQAPLTVTITGPSRLTQKHEPDGFGLGCGYILDWGDQSKSSLCQPELTHIYRTPGTYIIKANIYHLSPTDASVVDWADEQVITVK